MCTGISEEGVPLPPPRGERPLLDLGNNVLGMAERSPTISVRRISDRVDVSQMQVWRTLHDIGLYTFHLHTDQALQLTDCITRVNSRQWLVENQQLHTKILFTDEATFNRDGITDTRNSHFWSRKQIFRAASRLEFGTVLSEATSSGRLYLKST
jgi:hypothetical protein